MRHSLSALPFAALAGLLLFAPACFGGTDTNGSDGGSNDGGTDAGPDAGTDKCAGVSCAAPAPLCEGNVVLSYSGAGQCLAADGSCDFSAVEVQTNCVSSNQTCSAGACVGGDLCSGVTCSAPSASCQANIALSYSGAGNCRPADGSCDFSGVEVQTNCSTTNETCAAGVCGNADLCASVSCTQPADTCNGTLALTYSGAGSCVPADGSCDYSAVEASVDCAANSLVCAAGACVVDVASPTPGELVITEIMQNPNAVADSAGEWFELTNVAGADRNLEGLSFIDAGSNSFTVSTGAPVVIASGQYFVFGRNADSAANGGVTVDMTFTNFSLANGTDQITILAPDGTTVIDAVVWDNGATFPDPTGASMQFGSDHDLVVDDNALGANWCMGRSAYGDGDLGTPGGANETCALVAVPVTAYDLNDVTRPAHPQVGVPVVMARLVVSFVNSSHLWAQEVAGGAYSGVYVKVNGVDVTAVMRGDLVDLEGTYMETNGLTQLSLSALRVSGVGTEPGSKLLSTTELADPSIAELWENVVVRVTELGVTNATFNTFGEVSYDANFLSDDLLYKGLVVNNCDVVGSLKGVLNYSFGRFKIEPRDAADVGVILPGTLSAGATATVDILSTPEFSPADLCVANGTVVTWTNQGTVSHTVTERDPTLPSPNNIPASPSVDSPLIPGAGTFSLTTTPGTLHYRCRPHAFMEGRLVVLE